MTAFLAVALGAEALVVVVVERVRADPEGCGHGAGCCAGSVLPLWTSCQLCDPGPLCLSQGQGGLLC